MKFLKYGFLIIVCTFPIAVSANAQAISSNVLMRVLQIRYGTEMGASFTIEVNSRQYLVTAAHLVKELKDEGTINIFRNHKWQPIKAKRIQVVPEQVDIAILALPLQITPTHPVEIWDANMYISQDVYFLGFPFGLSTDAFDLNRGFPIPFVKKGVFSAFDFRPEFTVIFIDGHNNPGFSGGPIVSVDPGSRKLRIVGVVSGYRFQEDRIINRGAKTDLIVQSNTGILIGYSIKNALEAIEKNQIGPVVPADVKAPQ